MAITPPPASAHKHVAPNLPPAGTPAAGPGIVVPFTRERRDRKRKRLAAHPVFAGCRWWRMRRIASVTDEARINAGTTLVAEDRHSAWVFLVLDGVAETARRGRPTELVGAGAWVGEASALRGEVSSVTVRALTPMTVFVIARQRFGPLVDDVPALRRRFAMARRRAWFARRVVRRWRRPWPPSRSVRTTDVVFAAVVTAAVAVLAFAYHPPAVVAVPDQPIDITADITVHGARTYPVTGRYLLTAIHFEHPTLAGLIRARWSHRGEIAAGLLGTATAVSSRTSGVWHGSSDTTADFSASRVLAAAAAEYLAGYAVDERGTGAVVRALAPGSPAADRFQPGDVISAVDGTSTMTASGVDSAIAQARAERGLAGRVVATVQRGDESFTVTLPVTGPTTSAGARATALAPPAAETVGLTLATRDPSLHVPVSVTFAPRTLRGPSAGLVYALALYDMLTPGDLARGRTIAATGTVDRSGHVGPVGFVSVKGIGARRAGARVFLVPAHDLSGALTDATGVASVQDALAALTVRLR